MDEGQRTQASIKEKVSEPGGEAHPTSRKKDAMGENILTTHAHHRKNPPLGNRSKT